MPEPTPALFKEKNIRHEDGGPMEVDLCADSYLSIRAIAGISAISHEALRQLFGWLYLFIRSCDITRSFLAFFPIFTLGDSHETNCNSAHAICYITGPARSVHGSQTFQEELNREEKCSPLSLNITLFADRSSTRFQKLSMSETIDTYGIRSALT